MLPVGLLLYVEVITGFWWANLRERDHLEDLGVDGRITLKWTFKKWSGGIDWIYLAQDRDTWRARVNAVKSIRVSCNAGNLLTS
jgi:hypothetical protein